MIISKAETPFTPEQARYNEKRLDVLNAHYQKLINNHNEEQRLQCASYAMIRDGKLFANNSMGKLHYSKEDNRQCEYNSIKRIASITKLFTAVAVMKLVEDGAIGINQPVFEIMKEFDTNMHRSIQVSHLLNHTSGIAADTGAYFEPYESSWWEIIDKKDARYTWVEAALSGPIRNKPGAEWSYSSSGYSLLGEIIHRITGKKAEDWIEEMITVPLGMSDTSFEVPKEKWDRVIAVTDWEDIYKREDRMAEYKKEQEEKGIKEEYMPRTGGGLYSTTHDLAVFGQMLVNGGQYNDVQILSRKTIEKMVTDCTNGAKNYCWGALGEIKHYGLGPDLYGLNQFSIVSPSTFGHEGAGRTGLYIDPAENFVVAYFVPTAVDWLPESVVNSANIMWSGLS